ncbi:MAG TPA: hypothetical protein VIX19_02575, partial [Terriglobales bacterium]
TYEFLRRIEHRLQLPRGQQLHRLPASAEELEVLHRAAGRNERSENPATFTLAVESRMARVAEIYERTGAPATPPGRTRARSHHRPRQQDPRARSRE